MEPGLTLISTNWKDYGWGAGLKLLDRNGQVMHQWRVDPAELTRQSSAFGLSRDFAGPHGLHLFEGGDVVVELRGKGELARLNACGEVLWRLPDSTGEWEAHHSISRDEDGSLWVSGRRATDSGLPGLRRFDEVKEDLILHVSESGEVLDKTSVLDLLWENDLERYIVKHFENNVGPFDLTHINDVESLPDSMSNQYPLFESGDLVVSLRRPDLVFVFDPSSREVKWHRREPFINQHDPDFIGQGWIGIFDNNQDHTKRGEMLGGSRVVAVRPHTDSVKVLFPTAKSDPFYTPTVGEWQMLKNGNLLLTETWAGRVVEVNQNGRSVWEWLNKPYEGRERAVTEVFEAKRVPFTASQVASWPCSSIDSVSTAQNQQTAR
jgi:hypothetical protein